MVRVEVKLRNVVGWFFIEFYLEFSRFKKIDLHVFRVLMFLSYFTCVLRTNTQVTYSRAPTTTKVSNFTH